MVYTRFLNQAVKRLKGYLPENMQKLRLSIMKINENNNVHSYGLAIKMEEGYGAANIYMEGLFKQYQKGESLESLLKLVAEIYMGNRAGGFNDIGQWMADYKNVKDKLILQAINRNSALLEIMPYKEIIHTDLAVIFQVLFDMPLMGNAIIAVKNANAGLWGMDSESLYQAALNNTVRMRPPRVNAMRNIIFNPPEDKVKNLLPLSGFTGKPNELYVLTNTQFSHGASVMLYPGVLPYLAEKIGGSLYILPSSINEVLFMKDNGNLSSEELRMMLMTVNRGSLEPEEILSKEVYYYDKKDKILTMPAVEMKHPLCSS